MLMDYPSRCEPASYFIVSLSCESVRCGSCSLDRAVEAEKEEQRRRNGLPTGTDVNTIAFEGARKNNTEVSFRRYFVR
jgi:hypothetical protein